MAQRQKAATTAPEPQEYRVRIRMYRHGLGDCFLLSFPRKEAQPFHMLIDCGGVLGTANPAIVMTQVAKDIKATTGGKLDLLVITHEHWDHLSGFDEKQARAVFDQIQIDRLWLGWTEDDQDDLAKSLREEREKKKKAAAAAKTKAEQRALAEQVKRLSSVLGFFGAKAAGDSSAEAEDSGGTAGALAYLKGRCKPTILETGSSQPLPAVDGVRVYVVGPPKDGAAMRQTNPYKGEGYGFGDTPIGLAEAFLAAFEEDGERGQPFGKALRRPLQNPVNTVGDQPVLKRYYAPEFAWRTIDDDWLGTGERLALQLDNATNNTSLVLAIELEDGDVLLFVGDAQAGNWRSWESHTWTVPAADGEKRTVTSTDLLQRTIFYKVGHHGSHNATLRAKGLELMKSDRLVACIPVDTEVAHSVKGWVHMPLPAIRTRLGEKCAVVFQSDKDPVENRKVPGLTWVNAQEKVKVQLKTGSTNQPASVRVWPLYTDCFL